MEKLPILPGSVALAAVVILCLLLGGGNEIKRFTVKDPTKERNMTAVCGPGWPVTKNQSHSFFLLKQISWFVHFFIGRHYWHSASTPNTHGDEICGGNCFPINRKNQFSLFKFLGVCCSHDLSDIRWTCVLLVQLYDVWSARCIHMVQRCHSSSCRLSFTRVVRYT